MTSVLELAVNVAGDIGIEIPSTLISSTSNHIIRFRSNLDYIGMDLVRRNNTFGGGWVALTKEHTFTTQAGVEDYNFPNDYHHMIDGTVWPDNSFYQARGSLSPQEWQWVRSSIAGNVFLAPYYRIRATAGRKKFSIYPTPEGEQQFLFEYVSSGWLVDNNGNVKSKVTEDTDEPVLNDDMVQRGLAWRMRKAVGFDFVFEYADYEDAVSSEIVDDIGNRPILLTRGINSTFSDNIPESINVG